MKRFIFSLLVLLIPLSAVLADSPRCSFNTDGSITCSISGGGGDGEGNGGGNGGNANPTPPPLTCTPGATMWVQRFTPDDSGTCSMYTALVDQCTGGVFDLKDDLDQGVPCPEAPQSLPRHPCTTLTVSSGGIRCGLSILHQGLLLSIQQSPLPFARRTVLEFVFPGDEGLAWWDGMSGLCQGFGVRVVLMDMEQIQGLARWVFNPVLG